MTTSQMPLAVLYEQVLAVQTGDLVMPGPSLLHRKERRMLDRAVLDAQAVEHREEVGGRCWHGAGFAGTAFANQPAAGYPVPGWLGAP